MSNQTELERLKAEGEQNMKHVNPTDSLFSNAVRALAAIDDELGMPDDGCNSTQNTLTAIRLLHSAHRDDVAENKRLAKLLYEAIRILDGYKRAGFLTNPAAIEQATDFIYRARTCANRGKK